MSKSKPQSFESVRREIARRLQAGLPLAGMIAATTLLCGCGEKSSRGVLAGKPAPDPKQCEQKCEQPKPKTPAPPKKNDKSEIEERPLAGMQTPPPNEKNEAKRPITPGRTRREKPGK